MIIFNVLWFYLQDNLLFFSSKPKPAGRFSLEKYDVTVSRPSSAASAWTVPEIHVRRVGRRTGSMEYGRRVMSQIHVLSTYSTWFDWKFLCMAYDINIYQVWFSFLIDTSLYTCSQRGVILPSGFLSSPDRFDRNPWFVEVSGLKVAWNGRSFTNTGIWGGGLQR